MPGKGRRLIEFIGLLEFVGSDLVRGWRIALPRTIRYGALLEVRGKIPGAVVFGLLSVLVLLGLIELIR